LKDSVRVLDEIEGERVERKRRAEPDELRLARVKFWSEVLRMPRADVELRSRALLAKVGLANKADTLPAQLSGGQQQRVAIARALLNNPSILFADEPTGNLDSRTSVEVMDIFQRLKDERGITIVLITHEQQVAEYGSRIIAFKDGQIVSDRANDRQRVAMGELALLPAG